MTNFNASAQTRRLLHLPSNTFAATSDNQRTVVKKRVLDHIGDVSNKNAKINRQDNPKADPVKEVLTLTGDEAAIALTLTKSDLGEAVKDLGIGTTIEIPHAEDSSKSSLVTLTSSINRKNGHVIGGKVETNDQAISEALAAEICEELFNQVAPSSIKFSALVLSVSRGNPTNIRENYERFDARGVSQPMNTNQREDLVEKFNNLAPVAGLGVKVGTNSFGNKNGKYTSEDRAKDAATVLNHEYSKHLKVTPSGSEAIELLKEISQGQMPQKDLSFNRRETTDPRLERGLAVHSEFSGIELKEVATAIQELVDAKPMKKAAEKEAQAEFDVVDSSQFDDTEAGKDALNKAHKEREEKVDKKTKEILKKTPEGARAAKAQTREAPVLKELFKADLEALTSGKPAAK